MTTTPKFEQTLLSSRKKHKIDIQKWDNVLQLYKEGKFAESIIGILDYVDPSLAKERGNQDQTSFLIPHGSAIVDISLKDGYLTVNAPFLRVPDGGASIPMLRQVAQINFTPLDLAQIKLGDDFLYFFYKMPLDLCEPYKTYELFREICNYADQYDDVFIDSFGASWVQEPSIERFDQSELDKIWNTVQAFISEAQEYINHFEQQRMLLYALDVLSITLKKIEFYVAPQGLLRTKNEEMIKYLEANIPLSNKISKGKNFLKELQTYNRADFDKDIYKIQVFIPYKYNSSMDNIKANFEHAYKNAKAELDKGDHIGSSLTILYAFFNLFYYNDVRDNLSKYVTEVLLKTSSIPWKEASKELFTAIEAIMTDKIPTETKKRGFWANLFGFND